MDAWMQSTMDFLTSDGFLAALRASLYIIVGLILARLVSRNLTRAFGRHMDAQQIMLMRRISFYIIIVLAVVSGLRELGFDLTVLLGAAGILTVALGFASQTSASNLISGLFLIGERPFSVGDIIKVGDATGEVLSIDLLSVKLRTFDNLLVRVPNESLVKSQITNMTRFPIRRLDMQIGVAYRTDLKALRDILMGVADRNPVCLEEPKPLFIFLEYGDSALKIQLSVWARREKFLDLRNSMHMQVKAALDEAGIEIPFPQRTLSHIDGGPIPVRLIQDNLSEEETEAAEKIDEEVTEPEADAGASEQLPARD
ncbi:MULTISPECIES: mechanosensitive ion channel family protein [unclassified Thioalkalivibrio]|uniref:mechanosensitive ion channel family protein n=1 Tax=unclassified Thioalkalivibrio TaxID=2621013 RepID=UPI0003656766|nr:MULTISPECIES: mechanosensitive ion channel family protein [unclassified Thioalkalivibrio]